MVKFKTFLEEAAGKGKGEGDGEGKGKGARACDEEKVYSEGSRQPAICWCRKGHSR